MDYIIISKEDYDTKMLNLLEKIAEGNVPAAYVDPKGIPTIGIGINLRANLDSVLEWFGVDMDNLSTADATIVEKIRQTVNKSYTYGPAGDASLNNAIAPLFQQLSQKNRTTFAFNDQAEARTFFTAVIAPQYEAELQNWLTANNLPELTGELYSEERAVLFSLKYNESPGGIPLLGTNLSNALQNGDRLRAWFEIRYKSNLDKMNANRRYAESDLFGIWDGASPTQTELNNFASFLNQNDPYGSNISILQLIRNYEANYNPHARTDINSNRIDETINSPDVKSHFISQYAPGATIDGNVIIGTELSNTVIPTTGNLTKQQVQNGFLKSTALNDLVLGGSGNDTITGGTGNDILMGGADDDAYIVNNGDGTDTIEDKQGNNKVMLCGKPLKFFYDKGGYQYTTADGTITAEMQGTDLVVTHTASGTKVILNEDFQPGDFGINLLNMPDAPTNTILGDLTPTSDPPQYDSLGNVIVDPNTPSPDRNDYLYDSIANDRIEGKGGNDILHAIRGGDGSIKGSIERRVFQCLTILSTLYAKRQPGKEGGVMKKILFLLILFFLSSISFADEYVLVMSKEDSVCQHMLKLYNNDLKKYGQVRYDQHKEFTAIEWGEIKYYMMREGKKEYPPSYASNMPALMSKFDINNDGKEEVVIKIVSSFKGILSENLYYFKHEDTNFFQEDEFDVKLLYTKATGSIRSGTQNTYKLKELPQFLYLGIGDKESKAYYSLGGYLYLHPFFLKGTYYLDVKDEIPFDNKEIYSSKFLLIIKYTKDNKLQDICYYLKSLDCKNKKKRGE